MILAVRPCGPWRQPQGPRELYPAVPTAATQKACFCSETGTAQKEGSGVKVIVGISGASGAIYGLRLLERLRGKEGVEVHLILTRSGEKTLFLETGKTTAEVKKLADHCYSNEDIGCRLVLEKKAAKTRVVAPGSMPTGRADLPR